MIEIDLTTIIVTLIGSIFSTGAIMTGLNFIIFRKQNKTIKTNEAKTSNLDVEAKTIENDNAQIDLGKKYIESSMEIIELMKKSNQERDDFYDKQNKRFNEFEKKIDKLQNEVNNTKTTVQRVDSKVNNIENRTQRIEKEQYVMGKFLNGELTRFKKEHQELMQMQEEISNKETQENKLTKGISGTSGPIESFNETAQNKETK